MLDIEARIQARQSYHERPPYLEQSFDDYLAMETAEDAGETAAEHGRWIKKLIDGATTQVRPPFAEISAELRAFGVCSPEETAVMNTSTESLVTVRNETAYATVCSFDNLELVRQLKFRPDDPSFIDACLVSAVASPNASYRIAGYLLLTGMYSGRSAIRILRQLIGFWFKGFGSLRWPDNSWLDDIADGPKYKKVGNGYKELTTGNAPRTPPELPPEYRMMRVIYEAPTTFVDLTTAVSRVESKVDEAALEQQQFLNQASKLFALTDYFGLGVTLAACREFQTPSSSGTGNQFVYRDKFYVITLDAATNADKVIKRLIGKLLI